MDYFSWQQWIGYVASAFVVASFLVHNNVRLMRIINLIGAIGFTIYGMLINSIPIIIPNAVLIVIQIYYLAFVKQKKLD